MQSSGTFALTTFHTWKLQPAFKGRVCSPHWSLHALPLTSHRSIYANVTAQVFCCILLDDWCRHSGKNRHISSDTGEEVITLNCCNISFCIICESLTYCTDKSLKHTIYSCSSSDITHQVTKVERWTTSRSRLATAVSFAADHEALPTGCKMAFNGMDSLF